MLFRFAHIRCSFPAVVCLTALSAALCLAQQPPAIVPNSPLRPVPDDNQPTDVTAAQQSADQPTEDKSDQQPVNPAAEIQRRLDQLKSQLSDSQLEESVRQEVEQSLSRATTDLESIATEQGMIADLQKRIPLMSGKADSLKNPPQPEAAADPETLTTQQLEEQRAALEVKLTSARQSVVTPEAAMEAAQNRRRELQQQMLTQKQSLDAASEKLRSLPAESTTATDAANRIAAEARRLRLATQYSLTETSLTEVDTQLALTLPALQSVSQQRQVALLTSQLDALKAELEERRREESAAQLSRAQDLQQALKSIEDEDLRELATLRLKFAGINDHLTQQAIPASQKDKENGEKLLTRLEEEKLQIEERVREFGPTGTIGRELLHFQDFLPQLEEIEAELKRLDKEISDLRLRQSEYFSAMRKAEQMAGELDDTATQERREIIEGTIEVIRSLQLNSSQLFTLLTDLDGQQRKLQALVEGWNQYVSEQALWFRSHGILWIDDFTQAPQAAMDLTSGLSSGIARPSNSQGLPRWLLFAPALIAVCLLLFIQSRARRSLTDSGEQAERRTCITLRPTLRALLLTFGLAAEWPLVMMFMGNVVRFTTGSSMAHGFGTALVQFGSILLWLNFLRQLFRTHGLADSHFHWNNTFNSRVRSWLRNAILVSSLPLFLFLVVRNCGDGESGLDRILFIAVTVAVAVMTSRLLLPPGNSFVSQLTQKSPLLTSTRYFWTIVCSMAPLVLTVLSVIGFHYTAMELWSRLGSTMVAASILVVAHAILLRWVKVNAKATSLELARERAQQRSAQQQESEQSEVTADSSLPPVPAEEDDLEMFGLEARSLIRNLTVLSCIAMLWVIWSDVLPALRVIDRFEVWSVTETVADVSEEGESDSEVVRRDIRWITVGDVALAVFALVTTFMAVRQLPSLIEILVLARLQVESGLRYAIKTVTRYLLLVAGIWFACVTVGMSWSQVQWLIAGLSVGLGFGLQEVFANFVCGIIILFERPIRIGDVVTIDGVSGVVSRIQIRATSITDWDRREYIVPNREFVTGKLLNWTLSDTTNRAMINVGVAYGSDTDRAREIILEVATAHPNVMTDPAPIATFENFGDSSLDLVLRAYLPNLENRLATISELYTEINKRFTDERINIPFPQRDLHVFMESQSGSPGKDSNVM